MSDRAAPGAKSPVAGDSGAGDLAWLTQRAADALRGACNVVSREAGLADLRDWHVLALADDGSQRSQFEIATALGMDKSTLASILDRLEDGGLVVRTCSRRDRRVRIPRATAAGAVVKERVAAARDAALGDRLAAIPAAERARFHAMLLSIVEGA